MNLLLAIFLGSIFGYALYSVGATHTDKIIKMLTLVDFELAKTIVAAIGLSSALLFIGIEFGWFNPDHMNVKTMNLGVIIGAVLFGAGWAISGMCPGTAITNLGAGRKDAVFFVLGGMVGAGIFTYLYDWFASFGIFEAMLGGKISLATATENHWMAIVLGFSMVAVAMLLPKFFRKPIQ